MGGQTDANGTQFNDIAAYLATLFTDLGTVAVSYQTAKAFTIPNITLNSTYGDLTGLQTVSAPSKGTVTFSGTTATYTPFVGQFGADSFTYRAVRAAGSTNTRTVNLNIATPSSFVVTIVNTGNGSGTVTSSPGGINCGATCAASFSTNSTVTLTATPNAGSFLVGLGGQATNTYSFVVTSATTVYVNFNALTNDNFADRLTATPNIGGAGFGGSGYNVGATREIGEPLLASHIGGRSVWWTWTAPSTGATTVATTGTLFDTLLGVFTGSSVGALTSIGTNDDFNGLLTSSVTFYATAGTAYHIAIDGFNGATGFYSFTVRQPGNDNFVNRLVLSGGTVNVLDTNVGTNKETGEPNHEPNGNVGGHSVWWSWTAPVTGPVSVTTVGSNFDTLLGVYTGTAVNALTLITSDDDNGGSATSAVSFAAVAGTPYQIAVDGFNNGINGGATGNFGLPSSKGPVPARTKIGSWLLSHL